MKKQPKEYFWSTWGECYHEARECPPIADKKYVDSGPLPEAKRRSRRPCKRCAGMK
jgi:hypothetical protein